MTEHDERETDFQNALTEGRTSNVVAVNTAQAQDEIAKDARAETADPPRITEESVEVLRAWREQAEAKDREERREPTRAPLLPPEPGGDLQALQAAIDRAERQRQNELKRLERRNARNARKVKP